MTNQITITRRSRNLGYARTANVVQCTNSRGQGYLCNEIPTEPQVKGGWKAIYDAMDSDRRIYSGGVSTAWAFFVAGRRVISPSFDEIVLMLDWEGAVTVTVESDQHGR